MATRVFLLSAAILLVACVLSPPPVIFVTAEIQGSPSNEFINYFKAQKEREDANLIANLKASCPATPMATCPVPATARCVIDTFPPSNEVLKRLRLEKIEHISKLSLYTDDSIRKDSVARCVDIEITLLKDRTILEELDNMKLIEKAFVHRVSAIQTMQIIVEKYDRVSSGFDEVMSRIKNMKKNMEAACIEAEKAKAIFEHEVKRLRQDLSEAGEKFEVGAKLIPEAKLRAN